MNTADSDFCSPETTNCSCSTYKCYLAAYQQCDMQSNNSTYATRKADLQAASCKTNTEPTESAAIFSNQKTYHSNETVQTCIHDLDTGSATAMYELACCCINNSISDESVHYIVDHAVFKMKLNYLAKSYACGFAEPDDDQTAFLVFKHAEDQNDPDVLCALGRCYNYGWGVGGDIDKAVSYYIKAADIGSWQAMERLKCCRDHGASNQLHTAYEHFKCLADSGNATAQFNVAYCCYHGVGVGRNDKIAAAMCQKAAGSDALVLLGQLHQFGRCVAEDVSKALKLYSQAADAGSAEGASQLAWCHEYGIGVTIDIAKQAYWLYKAAQQGHAASAFKLACCYEYGVGVEQDDDMAFKCLLQAAVAGESAAQYGVGRCYLYGISVQQRYNRALFWLRKAADQGNECAAAELRGCQRSGSRPFVFDGSSWSWANPFSKAGNAEMPSFRAEIAFLLAKLAAADYCQEAFKLLGDCYYLGICVDRDFNAAAENYELASLTDSAALLRLAHCYLAAESDYGEISAFSALRRTNAALRSEINKIQSQML